MKPSRKFDLMVMVHVCTFICKLTYQQDKCVATWLIQNNLGPKSKLFDIPFTLMLSLKELFEKVDFETNQQTTKIMQNYPEGKALRRNCKLGPELTLYKRLTPKRNEVTVTLCGISSVHSLAKIHI